MGIGKKICALRKSCGYTQEELGEKLGVSRQTVSKWESGAMKPDVEKIVTISKLFKIPTDALLIEEPDPNQPDENEKQNASAPEAPSEKISSCHNKRKRIFVVGSILALIGLAGLFGVVFVHMGSTDAGDVTVFYTTSYISRNALLAILGVVFAIGLGLLIYWFVTRKNTKR